MHVGPQKQEEEIINFEENTDLSGSSKLSPLLKRKNDNEKIKELEALNNSKNNKLTLNFKPDKEFKSKIDISATLMHSAQNTNLSTPKNHNLNLFDAGSHNHNNFLIKPEYHKKPAATTLVSGVTTKNNSRKPSQDKNERGQNHLQSPNKNYLNVKPQNKYFNNTILNSNNPIASNTRKEKEKVSSISNDFKENKQNKENKEFTQKGIISSTISSSKVSLKQTINSNNSNQNSNSNFMLTGSIKKSPIDLSNILRTNVPTSTKINLDDINNYSSQNTGKNTPNSKAFLDGSSKPVSAYSKNSSANESKSKVDDLNNQIVKNGLKMYDNVQNNLNINKKNLTEKNNILKKKTQVLSIPVSTQQSKLNTKLNSKSENMSKVDIPINNIVNNTSNTNSTSNSNNKPIENNNYFTKVKKEVINKDYNSNPNKKLIDSNINFTKHKTSNNSPTHYPLQFNKEVNIHNSNINSNNNSKLVNHQPKVNSSNYNYNHVNHINNINININHMNSSKVSHSSSLVKGKENDHKILSLKTKSIIERDHKTKENIKNTLNTSNTSIISTVRESNYYKGQAENLINYIKSYYQKSNNYPETTNKFYKYGKVKIINLKYIS